MNKSLPDPAPIELMNLPEGRASLSLPGSLSPESLQEVEYWLMLILRQKKRMLGIPVQSVATPTPLIQQQVTKEPEPVADKSTGDQPPTAEETARMYPGPPGMGGNT